MNSNRASTVLAHLSDFHLLEAGHRGRALAGRARLSYLSLLRPLDAEDRLRRARAALEQARREGFDQLLLTGDLTEDAADAQFELLAELLLDSGIPASRITLVPGNHDAYDNAAAWQRAMDGPLRAFAATSRLSTIMPVGDLNLLPISTAVHQTALLSSGRIEDAAWLRLQALAEAPEFASRPLVVIQHHPPARASLLPMQWIDGFRQHAELAGLLLRHPHLHVVHGHTHRARDRALLEGGKARVFSTEAVVDGAQPLRRYFGSAHGLSPFVPAAEPREATALLSVAAAGPRLRAQ